MNRVIKKIHIYCGILNFSILLVFGITGLTATFDRGPEGRRPPEAQTRFEPYAAPPSASDRQIADDVYRRLAISDAGPDFALRRDRDQNLSFTLYTPNGPKRITVLEREGRLRIETVRQSLWRYFSNLHETTIKSTAPDWRVRLWKYYNEFSIWSLSLMALSGVYLGLTSRPGYRPALWALAIGLVIFIALYIVTL